MDCTACVLVLNSRPLEEEQAFLTPERSLWSSFCFLSAAKSSYTGPLLEMTGVLQKSIAFQICKSAELLPDNNVQASVEQTSLHNTHTVCLTFSGLVLTHGKGNSKYGIGKGREYFQNSSLGLRE